jgi:hypothetical protein
MWRDQEPARQCRGTIPRLDTQEKLTYEDPISSDSRHARRSTPADAEHVTKASLASGGNFVSHIGIAVPMTSNEWLCRLCGMFSINDCPRQAAGIWSEKGVLSLPKDFKVA